MKILCLHGRNQNGQIFREQLGTTIKMAEELDMEVSFDFPDAPMQCTESSPDGQTVFKFFDVLPVSEIYERKGWLESKLKADGPYDGVIGFCEGATLASSYLLSDRYSSDKAEPPLKFLVFISGGLSLRMLEKVGVSVPNAAEDIVAETERRHQRGLGPLSSHVSQARRAMFDSDNCFGLNLNEIPRRLKFRIPTVHIWGANDARFPTSVQLAALCDPYIREIYTHAAGHEVPHRTEDDRQGLGRLVVWCMQQATKPGRS